MRKKVTNEEPFSSVLLGVRIEAGGEYDAPISSDSSISLPYYLSRKKQRKINLNWGYQKIPLFSGVF